MSNNLSSSGVNKSWSVEIEEPQDFFRFEKTVAIQIFEDPQTGGKLGLKLCFGATSGIENNEKTLSAEILPAFAIAYEEEPNIQTEPVTWITMTNQVALAVMQQAASEGFLSEHYTLSRTGEPVQAGDSNTASAIWLFRKAFGAADEDPRHIMEDCFESIRSGPSPL